jgi:hypothetical protein
MKYTPWFDDSVKPVRDGVYQRLYDTGPVYSKLSGGRWYMASSSIKGAAKEDWPSCIHGIKWRGLKTKDGK